MDNYDISQISAEMLLNYLYPEMAEEWIPDNKGTFYRNYNRDILALYPEEKRVELSRDSFLKLLPQGVLAQENDLRGAKDVIAKSKELEHRIHILNEAFLPFDTLHFRRTIRIEQQIADLVRDKVGYILKTYYDFDITEETNPYVKAMAMLLPYAKRWRGDFPMLRNAMEILFGCPVRMSKGRYSYTDSTLGWLPYIRFELQIPDLDVKGYQTTNNELKYFADFVAEWFIPAEMVCQIKIKEHGIAQLVNSRLMLDYNTELGIEN